MGIIMKKKHFKIKFGKTLLSKQPGYDAKTTDSTRIGAANGNT